MNAFACPSDCGYCCSHLAREPPEGESEFREILREHGVYSCADGGHVGLALSNDEATRLRAAAKERRARLPLHPRTWLIETRHRKAVVLDWHMPASSCPMLVDLRCTAYEARPLVCRAYPVLTLGRGMRTLAPECPKVPIPAAALRGERAARRAIEDAHAKLDALSHDVLAAPGARFASGLTLREATARLRRYTNVPVEGFASAALATR